MMASLAGGDCGGAVEERSAVDIFSKFDNFVLGFSFFVWFADKKASASRATDEMSQISKKERLWIEEGFR
jgi:hypothetical protein